MQIIGEKVFNTNFTKMFMFIAIMFSTEHHFTVNPTGQEILQHTPKEGTHEETEYVIGS